MEFSATLRALPSTSYLTVGLLVLACVPTLIVMRFLFVYAMLGLRRLRGTSVPVSHLRGAAIISWAGTRGPVSGMAAFSLPLVMLNGDPLPERNVVLATTFGVIVVTLLLSYTLAPLARLLKIPPDDDAATVQRVRGALAAAALQTLTEIEEEAVTAGQPLPMETVEAIRTDLQTRLEHFNSDDPSSDPAVQPFTSAVKVKLRLIQAEKEALIGLRDDEGLPDAIVRPIMAQLDVREQALH
jgi:CPA1 family monovalent cation:H+ antiporter